ncbi:MAG: sigma-70 family RNA polymerase sigma factor [Ruminococcaceae bacterium]|nr:sigma-70 family RNA polymerase sigma factor [Oscillospiraceae bacterium]
MFCGKVEICGVDTSKLKVLKEKEKELLLKKFKEGDMSARDELVLGNLRLVLSVVQRFTGRGENMDDLFQVGCIGLIKSIENFDITQNVRFSTYAVPMVIECRNPRKDFESYDQKNRIITGNFATLRRPKEYRDLRET